MNKVIVLYNSLANNGKGFDSAQKIAEFYPDQQVEFVDVVGIKSYKEFFAGLSDQTVVLTGGDGTINRFANDVAQAQINNDVYYYPSGTGNDFWTDIGGQDAPVQINDYLVNLPIVTVNGKSYRFVNNVGFGIDGYCCEVGDQLRATSDKPINYAGIAIKGLLGKFDSVTATVTVDGVTETFRHCWLAPTMKGRFYGGGMMATPSQDRSDSQHRVSVMVMFKRSRLGTLIAFPSIFKGEHIKKTKMVRIFQGNEVHVSFDRPCALQIDGETILGVTEYTVTTK